MDTERKNFWETIANSQVWKDFWLSEDVAKMETEITQKILSMQTTDPHQISYHRGRLAAIQQLRNLPAALLKVEEDILRLQAEHAAKAEEELLRTTGRGERSWLQKLSDHLPRISN